VLQKLFTVYRDLFRHDGYGTLHLEMKFLKKGQKEALINCGKEYRFVVSCPERRNNKFFTHYLQTPQYEQVLPSEQRGGRRKGRGGLKTDIKP
jgi:hypothetical protein